MNELPPEHLLHVILSSALKAKVQTPFYSPAAESPQFYWNATHFGLNRVKIFNQTTQKHQNQILHLASYQLLEEAYFIEKLGMNFAAKMILLSETTQEKMIYSLFASDEAIHLHSVLSILGCTPHADPNDHFIRFLSDLIHEGDRTCLVFLIQVILEGWGLLHYRSLAENCLNPAVSQSLRHILKDEARHHGTGMTLSKGTTLNSQQKHYTLEKLGEFLKLIQGGPQSLVGILEKSFGHFNLNQKIKLFEELNTQQSSQFKINIIRSLISQGGNSDLIPELEKAGVTRPLTPQECV